MSSVTAPPHTEARLRPSGSPPAAKGTCEAQKSDVSVEGSARRSTTPKTRQATTKAAKKSVPASRSFAAWTLQKRPPPSAPRR
eukprot:scaffold53992_cov61-Phaeocystis_antarctica.AAC.1